MKGPGLRIDLDVRRVWRCPKCGRTVRTAAPVVSQRCGCSEQGNWMHLEPPVKRPPFVAPVREPLPEEDEGEEAGASGAVQGRGETASVAGASGETASVATVGGETASVAPAPEEVGNVAAPVVEVAGPGAEPAGAAPAPDASSATGEPPPAADPTPAPDDFGAGLEGNSTERV